MEEVVTEVTTGYPKTQRGGVERKKARFCDSAGRAAFLGAVCGANWSHAAIALRRPPLWFTRLGGGRGIFLPWAGEVFVGVRGSVTNGSTPAGPACR